MSVGDWLRGLLGRREPVPVAAPHPPSRAPRTALREGWLEALLDETRLLERWPEYAGVVARMDPVATNAVDAMAVALRRSDDPGSRVQLLVKLDWLAEHPELALGVLLHEIQHVRLGHLSDPTLHAVAHPRLMELALEISADEPIPVPIPDRGTSLAAMERFGIRAGQSSMERYRLLEQAYARGELGPEDLWTPRCRDTHRPRQSGGVGVGIGDLLDARSDRATAGAWGRARWGMGAPASRAELERMKLAIAHHLRGERGGEDDPLARTQRRVAKELQRVVFDRGGRGAIDWRRVLTEVFPAHRSVRPDYRRPSRRFPRRVGEIPGRARRPPRPALLVAIDTSGSMSGATLDGVVHEVGELARLAQLTIVECDAAVHRVRPLAARLGTLIGGGDTDFAPVFAEALEHAEGVVGVVYFTDGRGQMPPAPPSLPTLWVLTHDDPFVADFGSIVRMASR